jgi:hypothetical protein
MRARERLTSMRKRWDVWSWRQRILAVLGGVLSLAVGGLVCYFIAANLLIRTGLLRYLINDGLEPTLIEYRSAFSPWPGRVRVSALRIRDRGIAAEWMIALDEGRAHINLFDLLRGRFHPTRIRGKGLVILVRSRLTPEEATPDRLSILPPIPGFPAPTLREPGQKAPRPTGSEWTIWLENVEVDRVREIWVDDYHYTGDAALTGGMLLRLRRGFEVFPASLEVRSGTLRVCGEILAASVRANLAAVIHPYDLREESGDAVLKFLTGTGRATGRIESIHFLNGMLDTPPALRLKGGTGTLEAELSLDRGYGKGALDFTATGLEAVMPDATMTGEAEGQLRLVRLDLESGLADFSGSHLGVHNVLVKRGGETPWPWWGFLELVAGDLRTGPPRVLYGHLDLRAQDARPLYRLLNAQLPPWAESLLKMTGVTATADVALGKSFVDVKSLEAQGGTFHILGRYHAGKDSSDGAFLIDAGSLAVGVGLSGGTSRLQLVEAKSWYREHMER